MQLSLQSFTTIVRNSAAAVQSSCATLLDLTVGSVLRAILEGNASLMLWMQWLVLLVLQTTRLSTSQGTDVDTFVADFGLTRLPATSATGAVTFSRISTTVAALIQPYTSTTNTDGSITISGVSVKTLDGTQSFGVTMDTTNAAWSPSQGGYVVAIGATSVSVPVQALVAGSGGNVQAGSIGLIASAVNMDSVTNALAYTNGEDAETDAALRARFQNYINSRARATIAAIEYAISSVQQGLTYQIVENVDTSGATQLGNFVAYVDDGTGSPPTPLLNTVYTAIDGVRPIGSTFSVQPPTVISASIVMTISAASGYVSSNLTGPVAAAGAAYVNGLGMGVALPYSRLPQVAYDASPGVANVTSLTLNSGTADLGGTQGSVVRVGSITVNPA